MEWEHSPILARIMARGISFEIIIPSIIFNIIKPKRQDLIFWLLGRFNMALEFYVEEVS